MNSLKISNRFVSAGVIAACLLAVSPMMTFASSPYQINLGTAGNFVILTKTGVSTTGTTAVVGDIGVSPVAASYITGFSLILPSASSFSTSALVTGKVYASDYTSPTPSNLTTAILDMQTAYNDGAGRAANVTELGAGNIGGLTIAPGVYKWGTSVNIPTDVTLSGGPNDVWIFQIAQTLTMSSGTHINLSGGAQANNVFWIVAGQTTIGTSAVMNGNILDQTAIVLNTGARLNGRALAQTAVTLDSNAVTVQTSAAVTPTPSPVPTPTPTPTPTPSSTPNPTPSPTPSTVSDANVVALQIQLNGLVGMAQSLQAQVQAQQNVSIPVSSGAAIRTLATNLVVGSRGNDVMILQQFLISQNKGSAAQALAGAGATAYFGALTTAALGEFQASVGVGPTLGNFGPLTRSYISMHF